MNPKKISFSAAVKSAGLGATVFCLIVFQSSAFCRLTDTIETPSAQNPGNGIIEFGGGVGIYKPANSNIYGSDKTAWANFGLLSRLEGGITLYTSTRAAANIKLLLIDGGNWPSLAVGVKNITGKKNETFAVGAPGDAAVSNSVYGVISQNFHISKSLLTLSAGKGNRTFVDETGDFEGFRGAFAGLKLISGGICAAVEEDGRDVNCSLSFNFPTGLSIGVDARNLKENSAPKVFSVFLNFSNTMIEKRIAALEAKIETLASGVKAPDGSQISQSRQQEKQLTDDTARKQKAADKTLQEAMVLFNNKNFEKSIPVFEETLSLSPGNREAEKHLKTARLKNYFTKGHERFSEKKYAESIKFFEKVLELEPGHSASKEYIDRARRQIKSE